MYDRRLDLRVNVPFRNEIIRRNNPPDIKVSPLEIEIRDVGHIGLIFRKYCVMHTTFFDVKWNKSSPPQKITLNVTSAL